MIRTTALCALGGLMLAPWTSLNAQSRLDRDVAFVEKLAGELRFISLAQSEIERLQTVYRDSSDFKKVNQVGISVALTGARSHPDRERRRTLFKDTLERSIDFIRDFKDDPIADETRRVYVQAAYEFGQFLLDDLDIARTEAPDQVEELEKQAAEVFDEAIKACETVVAANMDALYEEGPARQQLFAMWLYKGMLQRESARAVRADREPRANIARGTLEELVFEAGQETLLGQRAYFEMSKVSEVLGDYANAYISYGDTISTIKKALDRSLELGIPPQTAELMFYLLQEGYDRAAICLFQQGKVDDTLATVGRFREDLKTYGDEDEQDLFNIAHPYYGHPVFLTEARAMAESGDSAKVSQALEQVQKINDLHPADIIGLRAKNVLEDILALQADQVSGVLLYEVAKGDYQEDELDVAVQGFKRAYAAMNDTEKDEFGLELWTSVSRCFGRQERYLESALAAIQGLERHKDSANGSVERLAELLDSAWTRYLREIKDQDNSALQATKDRVLELLAETGGEASEAKLLWKEGNRLYTERKFLEAAQQFSKIAVETSYYELARDRLVRCFQMTGDFDQARRVISEYNTWAETAELPADRSDVLVRRQKTLATMAFYDVYMDYQTATGDNPDTGKFRGIISKLQQFLETHRAGGTIYVPRSYDIMARLHAKLGEVDKSEELYRTLRSEAPGSALIPQLATQIFATHYNTAKSLETEVTAMDEKGEDSGAEYERAVSQLEAARSATVRSGLDYMQNADSPSYQVLFNTMSTARALARDDSSRWETVGTVSRRLIELFGEDPAQGEKVAKFVTPALGESLLRRRKFREAVPLLEKAAAARPNDYPLKRLLSLAEGGWFEFDNRGVLKEVIGSDEPVKAYQRHWTEYRKFIRANNVAKYSLEWYEFIFECYSFAKRAAKKGDSDAKGNAQTLYNMARSIDNFETLKTRRGKRGKDLYGLFAEVEG